MRVCVLASGSKGNCTYIETEHTRSLIDIGMSSRYVEGQLRSIGVDPSSIQRIFLTHTHSDHTNGLRVFIKKYNPLVYLTEKMDAELDILINNIVYINGDEKINDLVVEPIKTSHDVADSNGYVFINKGKKFLYMTDTGYINVRNYNKLKDLDFYILESNHDVQMLMDGPYPYHLKQRILGDKGHLSNKDCSYYLSQFTTDKTKQVVLAHLSEHNNDPEVALKMYYDTYKKYGKKAPNVVVAQQKVRTEFFEI
jgi:phosphoribosyl 1,2-cyclic phosphodiesterase